MEQDFKKRLNELSEQAFQKNIVCATKFLDPAESAAAEVFLRTKKDTRYIFSGGYDGAERARLFFLPDWMCAEDFLCDEYISRICAKYSFGTLTHRDFLGALMALGIKREAIGDILVFDDCAYIFCTPQISAFITENLTKAGRTGIKCEVCPLSDIRVPEPEFETVRGTVASLRADSIVSLAFSISRTSAAELIRDGKLSVDHIEEPSPSREITQDTLLSLRGYGRAKLYDIGGISKKGRHFIELHVFSKK